MASVRHSISYNKVNGRVRRIERTRMLCIKLVPPSYEVVDEVVTELQEPAVERAKLVLNRDSYLAKASEVDVQIAELDAAIAAP